MQGWWYAKDGQRHGPVSIQELQGLLRGGTISPRTLVWRMGLVEWRALAHVDELRHPADRAADAAPAVDKPVASPLTAVPESLPAAAPRGDELRQTRELKEAGPWRRFFAQLIDVWTFAAPSGFLVWQIAGHLSPQFAIWLSTPGTSVVFGILMLPISLLLIAVVFGLFGTTFGKAILGVRVLNKDGARPTFQQYLRRSIGLYWSGYGLALPLVTLITMTVQYRRVSRGEATSYDEGRFLVLARPMGPVRAVVATVSVVLVTGVVGYFNSVDKEQDRRYLAGFDWTNPVSGRVAAIPSGWTPKRQRTSDGDEVYLFVGGTDGVVAVLGKDATDMSLVEYRRAWTRAVQRDLIIYSDVAPVNANGRLGLEMRGVMANDRTRPLHVTLVKSRRQVWRLVLIGSGGKAPDTRTSLKLRDALFATLNPEQDEDERKANGV